MARTKMIMKHITKSWFFIFLLTNVASFADGGRLNRHLAGSNRAAIPQDRELPAAADSSYLGDMSNASPASLSIMKSRAMVYTNTNGDDERYEQRKAVVQKGGRVVARIQQELNKQGPGSLQRVKTMLDIPSKHLHRVIEHVPYSTGAQETPSLELKLNSKYQPREFIDAPLTPLDIAEYVFWTGDDKGASTAIQEFLKEGLISRKEAASFLEEVKQNLRTLDQQYSKEFDAPKLELLSSKFTGNRENRDR